MHPQTLFAAITVLAMGVVPTLALPEPVAIPELLVDRAQCIGGDNLVGSGCAPARKGKTSCSANDRAVVSIPRCYDHFDQAILLTALFQVICKGSGPTWQVQNKCQNGSCNNNCVCT